MFRHFLASLVAVFSLLHGSKTYTEVIDRVQSSLVRVTGVTADSDEHYVCSGFVVAPLRVLTAAHCVSPQMYADGSVATVLKSDDYYDLAVVSTDTMKPVLTFRDKPVARFELLSSIGYAFGWSILTVIEERVLIVDLSPSDDAAAGTITQPGAIGGMSGGPVVDVDGRVVGIVQRSNHGVGYGVGVLVMRAFLLGTDVSPVVQ